MNIPTSSPPWLALLAGLCLVWPTASSCGRDFVETATSDVVELLASDRADESSRGERLVLDNRAHYIAVLLERLRTGDIETKGKAASELGIIISPWIRGKEASARFYSFTSFQAPRRPVGRVPDFPGAGEIRHALQTTITALLKASETPSKQTHWISESLRASCETLGEVADDKTLDWALDRLQQISAPHLAEPLLALGDSYLGIPPIFRRGALCGNSSRAEVESFQRSQEQALAEAFRILSMQWTQVRPMSSEERIGFAIKSWRDYFVPKQRSYSGQYFHEGWLFQEMEPLVRFGKPAVTALRAQQALETELEAKAVWEAVIATITGHEDALLVRELFNGSDAHRELACEIVVCATSRDWLPQLDELQSRSGFQTGKASEAIAVCHREEGISALKRAFARNSYNFHAGSSVKELEVRATSGPPRGMRRYRFP